MTANTGFDALHERVQRWVWKHGWKELREIQEAAVAPILGGKTDLILAAATAAGKTEAAFLPIASLLVRSPKPSVQALYVSPLKALINDQHRRLDELCEGLEVPVHRWHGDVGSGKKRKVLEDPSGVLLITPESLEALFVLRGGWIPALFADLGHIVIDELHSFLGSERGRQLQSLLHRLDESLGRRVPRIGLSATLGDLGLAAEFLRPDGGADVETIVSASAGSDLAMGLKLVSSAEQTARILHKALRGASHLVFAPSRTAVEEHAALLRVLSEEQGQPNEFFPHHASLSKELREDAEARLREGTRPTTVVCTSTLEMGIDVGELTSVAQIGAPPSVAALRQRLGRSGRRGEPAILRLFARLQSEEDDAAPQDRLQEELVQMVAMCELMLAGWVEAPPVGALHLSTLVQQILSVIAERSGARADELFELLCKDGPFRATDVERFGQLLRDLGQAGLLVQEASGALLPGPAGERLVEHYTFYASFQTPEEMELRSEGRSLGRLPVRAGLTPGAGLVFAGRSWVVEDIDFERGRVDLAPGMGGEPPRFEGSSGDVDDEVRREMRRVLAGSDEPTFLDAHGSEHLASARAAFRELGLAENAVVEVENETLWFPWRGDRVLRTLQTALVQAGTRVSAHGMALAFPGKDLEAAHAALHDLEADGRPDPEELAAGVGAKAREKYDDHLSEELLAADYASRDLDAEGAWEALGGLG